MKVYKWKQGVRVRRVGAVSVVPKKVATVKTVKRIIRNRLENKFHVVDVAATEPGTTLTMTCLNGIAQGDREYERTGNTVRGVALEGTVRCQIDADNTRGDIVRIFIVRDKHCLADTLPTEADLFAGQGALYGSMKMTEYQRDRFQILYDRMHVIGTSDKQYVIQRIRKSLHDKLIMFNGTAYTDYDKHSLFLGFVCHHNTADQKTAVQAKMIMRFIDG